MEAKSACRTDQKEFGLRKLFALRCPCPSMGLMLLAAASNIMLAAARMAIKKLDFM
jgi:hypothetical protein